MNASICWAHIGDLHLDQEDANGPWHSRDLLAEIVAQLNAHAADGVDFAYLPGDTANHGTPEQYRELLTAVAPLSIPWRSIAGDHDFEPGDLAAYEAAIPAANRPKAEMIAGHRCLFLDIVSPGAGGPDFRLTLHDRNRIGEELARAAATGETPLVFMHAYPGDLAADGEEIARMFADGGVAFVDTGHTHYNEVLNDDRVIYAATRSTGQIEEDGGTAGFAIVCVHEGVPSWRFRRLDAAWPHVQIVSPRDARLVTRPAEPLQVPRTGEITVTARILGVSRDAEASVRVDGGPPTDLWRIDGLWTARVAIDTPGLHTLEVTCAGTSDRIDLLVREAEAIPKRRPPVALGHACHAVGAWPIAGIDGFQLGPNKNGRGW